MVKSAIGICALCIVGSSVCKAQNKAWFETNLNPEAIYKIVTPEHYHPEQEDCCIEPSELDRASGFIHASYGHQVENTIAKFFKEAPLIFIVELDSNALLAARIDIRPENNKPGGTLYPHLYNSYKIPSHAVHRVFEYKK